MMTTFLERLDYCRRLAAQKGRLPSLGAGYRAIMLARFGPLFYTDAFGGDARRAEDSRRFVLQDLREARAHLEKLANPIEGTRTISAARLLVRDGTMSSGHLAVGLCKKIGRAHV